MNGQRLAMLPGFLDDRSVAHIFDLLHDVQFAKSVNALSLVLYLKQRRLVLLPYVAHVSQPIVN